MCKGRGQVSCKVCSQRVAAGESVREPEEEPGKLWQTPDKANMSVRNARYDGNEVVASESSLEIGADQRIVVIGERHTGCTGTVVGICGRSSVPYHVRMDGGEERYFSADELRASPIGANVDLYGQTLGAPDLERDDGWLRRGFAVTFDDDTILSVHCAGQFYGNCSSAKLTL